MFSEPDPLERDMKLRVEDMSADQLVLYLKEYQQKLNDIKIAIVGTPEFKRMEWLIEIYGQPDAGRIIKWTYWKHRGRWAGNRGPEVIKPMRFNAKMKWWIDIMHVEMQEELTKESAPPASKTYAGFATAADL